jgi:hypothetical protein
MASSTRPGGQKKDEAVNENGKNFQKKVSRTIADEKDMIREEIAPNQNGSDSDSGAILAAEDLKLSATEMEDLKSFSLLARLEKDSASVRGSLCCIQLQSTEAASVDQRIRQCFLFPQKSAVIPVSDAGLLYLTLDRKTEVAGEQGDELKEFSVKVGDFIANCKILHFPLSFPPALCLKNMPLTVDMAVQVEKLERLTILPKQRTLINLSIVNPPSALQQSLYRCAVLPRLKFKRFSQHVVNRHQLEIMARTVTLQRDGSVSLPILNRSESKKVVLKQGQFFGLMILVPPILSDASSPMEVETVSSSTLPLTASNVAQPEDADRVKNVPLMVSSSRKRGASALKEITVGQTKEYPIETIPEKSDTTASSSELDQFNRKKLQKLNEKDNLDAKMLNQNTLNSNQIKFTNIMDRALDINATPTQDPSRAALPFIFVRLHIGQHKLPFSVTVLHYIAAVAINPQTETVTKCFIPLPMEGSTGDNLPQHKSQLAKLIEFFTSLQFQTDGESLVLTIVSSALCPVDPASSFENMLSNNQLAGDYFSAVDGTTDVETFQLDMSSFPQKGMYWKPRENWVLSWQNYKKAAESLRECYLGISWVSPLIKDFLMSSCDPLQDLTEKN